MKKIGYVNTNSKKAKEILLDVLSKYGSLINAEENPDEKIDVLLVFGGDGFMLHSIHKYIKRKIPIYGINCGTIGFLLNEYKKNLNLIDVIENAYSTKIRPLKIIATDYNGCEYHAIAINELSVFRNTYQSTLIKIKINNIIRINQLIGDGLLLATALGSSAYNFSAGGPILPITSRFFALTGINIFRPRRWKSALLPDDVSITLEIIDAKRRPVIVAADHNELCGIEKIEIYSDSKNSVDLLFYSQSSLNDKTIIEQFLCN